MSSVIRITGPWTRLLLDWLHQEQISAPHLRAELINLSHEETVPVQVWRRLLQEGLALAPRTRAAPELDVGALVQPEHVGVLGYLVLASDTLGGAMLAYQRYEQLFYGVRFAHIDLIGDDVEIRWPYTNQENLGQQADGVSIAALVTFLRRQLPDPPPLSSVTFHEPVSQRAARAYESFFQCPVHFGDEYVRVRLPQSQLTLPMPHRDPALRQMLDRQARALMRALPSEDATEQQLRRILLRLLAEGDPTLANAARRMHMAPRTLQRRLAAHQLSWQQWLDRSREQLAREYLADPGLTLNDIALLLGFSEQSAFNRAYRRWTGGSPGHDRRRLRHRERDPSL